MKLKVSKEITCKWQNQRSAINKYVSWALFLKLQPAINLKKADKGTTTVIMNMADKIHEAKVQLDNRKYYERLKSPMVKTTQEKVNDLISRLHQGERIDDMI